MRTTVTLDQDLAAALKALAYERGTSFKEVLNSTLRQGLDAGRRPSPRKRYRLPTYALHVREGIDLDKALRLADELEDAEILRKLELRK